MATKVSGFVQILRTSRMLEPAQLAELTQALQARFPDPRALAKELIQRGWLTPYQVNLILQGKARELVLGPYLIVDRLGEGANGQVFKARHQAMNRTVALKVLRQDLLADNDAMGRFYREIEVASRLSHPHIVHAYDAGPIGAAHVLAMEYVEGCDLDRLVREKGPLPIAQACDYIRQAALGLQHAHEKGLVHRDIKPSNLLVSLAPDKETKFKGQTTKVKGPVVKLLDLGLARLQEYAKGSKTGNLTLLAGNSVMMGTPDYLAPEQALDFHTADIRADIYSLGCTWFYLLTGQPPFPAKTLAEKLMKHQTAEVPSIAAARKDAPAELAPILAKMLAKQPKDRYQTPGEVAADLAALLSKLNGAAVSPPSDSIPRRRTRTDSPEARRRLLRLSLVSGAVLLAGLVIFGLLLFRSGPSPETHAAKPKSTGPETKPVVSDAPRPAKPFLIFQCGSGEKGNNQVQLRRPGYDCKLLQGANFKDWPLQAFKTHCWADEKQVRFEVTVPPGTAGMLRMWLVDGDNMGRKERLLVQGKTIGEYANFGPEGKEVTVPISAEDAKSGKINVSLVKLAGANAVVSTVEFDVLPSQSKR